MVILWCVGAIIGILVFIVIVRAIIRFNSPERMVKDLKKMSNIMNGNFNNKHSAIDEDSNNPSVYCQNCGAIVDMNSNFCKFCGKELFK